MSQTGTPEGDQLLDMIRQLVHGRVHPTYEETVVEIVARTVIHIFSDPNFYGHLKLVQDLQSRIIQLERALAIVTQQNRPGRDYDAAKKVVKKSAAGKVYKAPAKKAAKKLPSVSKKGPASLNVRQFRRGAKGQ